MLISAGKVSHDGTFIVSTTHGYAVVQAMTQSTSSGGDPCYFRTYTVIDGGVTDWQGVTMCYNYWAASISGSINQSCSAWFPGAACWYHYSSEPFGTWNTDFVEADGYFYQQCLYVIGCNDGIWQDQWYDGPYHAGTWTL
jgi:hypothetical protein